MLLCLLYILVLFANVFCGVLQSLWAPIVLQAGIVAAGYSPCSPELCWPSLHFPSKVLLWPAVPKTFFSVFKFSKYLLSTEMLHQNQLNLFFLDSTRSVMTFFSIKSFYSKKMACFTLLILLVQPFYIHFLLLLCLLWSLIIMQYWLEVLVLWFDFFDSSWEHSIKWTSWPIHYSTKNTVKHPA